MTPHKSVKICGTVNLSRSHTVHTDSVEGRRETRDATHQPRSLVSLAVPQSVRRSFCLGSLVASLSHSVAVTARLASTHRVRLGILRAFALCSPRQCSRLTKCAPTFALAIFREQQSQRASMRSGLQCLCLRPIENHVYLVGVLTLVLGWERYRFVRCRGSPEDPLNRRRIPTWPLHSRPKCELLATTFFNFLPRCRNYYGNLRRGFG